MEIFLEYHGYMIHDILMKNSILLRMGSIVLGISIGILPMHLDFFHRNSNTWWENAGKTEVY